MIVVFTQADEFYDGVLHTADVRVWRELRRTYQPLHEHLARHDEEIMTDDERERAERVATEAEEERQRLLAAERRRELDIAAREQEAVDRERNP